MLTKQFHDEAVRLADNPRLAPSVFEIPELAGDVENTAQPLLLRLLLNGWITDKEKLFLDSVAPQDCLTFLISERGYVHPEGVELFPFEEIETTMLHGGEAIFSHRYRPAQMKDSHQEYRIFSAAVNPGETEKIILGFFGPAHRLGTIDEDCGFSRLVEIFRQAYSTLKPELPQLREYLAHPQATIMVSRTSGRVQALNGAALKLFSRTDRAMVDIGLDQLKYHISPLLPSFNLKLENISVADLGMSVVALEPNSGKPDIKRDMMLQLSNQIGSGAANISLAASRFQNMTSVIEDEEKYRLSETIQAEAQKLRLVDRQLSLLTTYENAGHVSQTIEVELLKTINTAKKTGGKIAFTPPSSGFSPRVIGAPPNACAVLFDTILANHAAQHREGSQTEVAIENPVPGILKISFLTPVNLTLSTGLIEGHSDILLGYLASLLGIEIATTLNTETGAFITELTITK